MSRRPEEMVGRILANTYAVERLLGRGGMGAVYAARHVRTNGTFAVKVLNPEAAADEEIYRRFQNEARIISALRHPNIVQVTDFDQDEDGTPFLVMELLLGQDLYDRLREVERLPLAKALTIARQVGGALHAAHSLGIIHRDVKPQNIFLARHQLTDEIEEVAKVVDFGVSKIRHQGTMATKTMGVFGTPHYMAPETTKAQRDDLDGRVDQWALAVILYRALAGRLPFENPDPLGVLYQVVNEEPLPLQARCPELPEGIAQAIMRALAKDRDERFSTMAEFVRALDRAAAGVVSPEEIGREGAGRLAAPSVKSTPSGRSVPSARTGPPPLELVAEPEDEAQETRRGKVAPASGHSARTGAGALAVDMSSPELVGTAGGRSVGTPNRLGVMALFIVVALASAGAVLLWQRSMTAGPRPARPTTAGLRPARPATAGQTQDGAGAQLPTPGVTPPAGLTAPIVEPVAVPLPTPVKAADPGSARDPAAGKTPAAPPTAKKPVEAGKPPAARPTPGATEPRAPVKDGDKPADGHRKKGTEPGADPGAGEDPGEGPVDSVDDTRPTKGKKGSEVDKDI